MFLPPSVTSLSPTALSFEKGRLLTVYGANFGPPTLYDAKTRYIGPVGNFPREKYTPPEAVVVLPGGAHVACLKTLHVSDSEVPPLSQLLMPQVGDKFLASMNSPNCIAAYPLSIRWVISTTKNALPQADVCACPLYELPWRWEAVMGPASLNLFAALNGL